NWDVCAAEERFTTVAKEDHGWSETDQELYSVGLAAYGKRFDRIRLLLPHKPLNALVKHYYDAKKLQFYRKFYSEAGDEDDDAVPEETDVDSSIERANGHACARCLNAADFQVVPSKSSNAINDRQNSDGQVDNGVPLVASPVKRRSSAAEACTSANKLKMAIAGHNGEMHFSTDMVPSNSVAEMNRSMSMDLEKGGLRS
ncbi:Myb-like DNA-binding domain containing protein, partial [Aphelenchoides avenae]